jgi:valyl-tRNA synthetase
VRYWAASGAPGTDTATDFNQMKVGRRLAIKILNASRFTLGLGSTVGTDGAAISEPLDKAMLARLADIVAVATSAFDDDNYSRALERTEMFFWSFCNDYLELVKGRAYGDGPAAASARAALALALSTLLALFAPFLPFVTEEVWSWWRDGSVHRSPWPNADELRTVAGADADPEVLAVASEVLGAIRRAKSDANKSMRADVASAAVSDRPERLAAMAAASSDIRAAGRVAELSTSAGDQLRVDVVLA